MSELDKVIRVRDYTRFPGPRYKRLGPYSGEWFRVDILQPAVAAYGDQVTIDLDGVLGYGSSFLEESFAGLIREGLPVEMVSSLIKNLIAKDEPDLKNEIESYVKDQIRSAKGH